MALLSNLSQLLGPKLFFWLYHLLFKLLLFDLENRKLPMIFSQHLPNFLLFGLILLFLLLSTFASHLDLLKDFLMT